MLYPFADARQAGRLAAALLGAPVAVGGAQQVLRGC